MLFTEDARVRSFTKRLSTSGWPCGSLWTLASRKLVVFVNRVDLHADTHNTRHCWEALMLAAVLLCGTLRRDA